MCTSGEGSVYILDKNLPAKKPFIQTGPEQTTEYILIIRRSDQLYYFYREPSVRHFQVCSS